MALWLCAAGRADAIPWEQIRKTLIDPINTDLHRHLPRAIQERDLDHLLEFYATDTGSGLTWDGSQPDYTGKEERTLRWGPETGREPIRERYRRLIGLFASVERAELRLHRVHWTEENAEGIPADVRLVVRGRRRNGTFAQLDQRARIRIRPIDGTWRLTEEEIVARDLVQRRHQRFVPASESSGIEDVHGNDESPAFRLIGSTIASSGSAVADVDGDGCEDVFLAGSPRARLYRNDCDGTFTDVTDLSGLPQPYPAAATGVVFFDYDNDGWPDLYVAAARGGDRLFHNRGAGVFEDVTATAGIPAGRWGGSVAVADYDRDGHLDIYVIRMGDHEKTAPRPNYQAENGTANTLLRNQGDGTFVDVTRLAGVGDTGWGLAGAWGDYDDDGWPDLYVGNEFGFNVLYHNRGDGTFADVTRAAGASDRAAAMGVTWGDYDGDGQLDLYVSNMYANSRWALFHPEFPAPVPWIYRWLGWFLPEVGRRTSQIVDELTRGSTLLHNEGDGTFNDVSDRAGIRDGQWGWGAAFLDYDNDGQLDLYAVNGFVTGEIPDDA